MKDVVCIGSSTVDSFWDVSFPFVEWDTPTKKALAIAFGEKHGADGLYTTTGGNALNASITFARQGYESALMTRIGKDVFGDLVTRRLSDEGVLSDTIERGDGATAQGIIFLQGGERSIVTFHGGLNDFSLEGCDSEALQARWWYVSLPGESYKAFDQLLSYAQKHNIRVALNPSSLHLSEGREYLIEHLKFIDVLFVNEREASLIVKKSFSERESVFSLLDEYVSGIVVVTRGSRGVVVSDGKKRYEAGIFDEKELVDRTGAGDGFGSGFVSGLMKYDDIDEDAISEGLRVGSANATSIVESRGASEGSLRKEDLSDSRWSNLSLTISSI